MHSSFRLHRPSKPMIESSTWCHGLTLIEVLIVVILLGIATSIAVPGYLRWINRVRAESYRKDLVAWLEVVRSSARRKSIPCSVSFISVNNEWVQGKDVVATASPAIPGYSTEECSPQGPFRFGSSSYSSSNKVTLRVSASKFTFMPRGTVDLSDDLILALVSNGLIPKLCVRISPFSGAYAQAQNTSVVTATIPECTNYVLF